jgi:hypothetical protein
VLPKSASWEPETTLRRAQIESRLPARILVIVSDNFLFADNPGVERLFRPVSRPLAIWLDCFNLDQKAIRYVR